jgi:hypothetical protein
MMRPTTICLGLCAFLAAGCAGEDPDGTRSEPVTPGVTAAPADATPSGQTSPTDPQPAAEGTAPAGAAEGQMLQLELVVFTIPASWNSKPATSGIILAEFELPAAEGDEDAGRLTVSTAGGSVEDNLQRWRDQFGGDPESASEKEEEINGMKVTLVDFSGEYKDQRGPFAPATQRPGYRMLAAIIPVSGELHFVKAVGPAATIDKHADAFQAFIGSARKK